MSGPGFIDRLHEKARRKIVENVRRFAQGDPEKSLQERARRWWDLPAQYQWTGQIANEELAHYPSKIFIDDAGDAMRHAEWQRRSAEVAGPVVPYLVGLAHEADALALNALEKSRNRSAPVAGRTTPPTTGEIMDRVRMDLHNNAEGLRAARERRPVDFSRLHTAPRTPVWAPLFRSPPDNLTGLPPR